MPRGWEWDETLFRGSARYYERGRLPYPPGLADAIAATLGLDGRGRLLDVGCGPGTVALRLAHLFAEVVGLDADAEMLAEAERRAAELGIGNAQWVCARAEDLPADLGAVRVATFAASFHWMDRDRVAAAVLALLEPGGAFVQVSAPHEGLVEPDRPLPYPPPPRA
ncbi:MAG: class I SAM-dependent methyltransferase, partial [Chloroflexota bacterium]|nr:class I SAM-dependent methyltransferase [Chloroflexota bacterium]